VGQKLSYFGVEMMMALCITLRYR